MLQPEQWLLLRWHRSRCRVRAETVHCCMRAATRPSGGWHCSRCCSCGGGEPGGARACTRATHLVVDDSPTTFRLHHGNALRVAAYTRADAADEELRLLALLLPALARAAAEGDVRRVERRG